MSSLRFPKTLAKALEEIDAVRQQTQRSRLEARPLFPDSSALATADRNLQELALATSAAPRASRREAAKLEWLRWKKPGGSVPSTSALRTLCWEPDVVAESAFAECLQGLRPLKGRSLRALGATYIRLWRHGKDPDPQLAAIIKDDLKKLDRRSGALNYWADDPALLFSKNAPEELARHCIEARATVASRLADFELATDTEFARQAASTALELASHDAQTGAKLDWLLDDLLPTDARIAGEAGWGASLRNLVLNPAFSSDENIRERILDLALGHLELGDPRVSQVPWHPVGEKATAEVIRWRSSEDLRLFFDLIMKGTADHQGRHKFWGRYVDGVTRSRIALGRDDEIRLSRKLRDLKEKGRSFARLTGNSKASAFVMEFGQATVVEFSISGNACFIYEEKEARRLLDWSAAELSVDGLKKKRAFKHRLTHSSGWERQFSSSLARSGVRPVPRNKGNL